MARVDRRLAQAEAALATLEEIVGQGTSSLIERDGAVLRLIYTFEAMWKSCQAALAERDGHRGRIADYGDPGRATDHKVLSCCANGASLC